MARLLNEGESIRLRLSRLERLGALHVDVVVPRSSVTEMAAVPNGWAAVRGIRAPGTGLPRLILLGTTRGGFGRDFCAVRGRGPAVVVTLSGQPFERLVVSASDPEDVIATLRGQS